MTQRVASEVVIYPCEGLRELEACVELQRQVWGYADADLVPVAILIVAIKTGGHVLGAFDDGRLVGFALGFSGFRAATPYVHSHYLGVLPEYRDSTRIRRTFLPPFCNYRFRNRSTERQLLAGAL